VVVIGVYETGKIDIELHSGATVPQFGSAEVLEPALWAFHSAKLLMCSIRMENRGRLDAVEHREWGASDTT
jgi:hypothetical protein